MQYIVEDKEELLESKDKVVSNNISFFMIKRAFDLIASILALPFAIILVVIFGLLTKLEDGGSVFYTQVRVGKNLKEFKIFKIRSMKMNAEASTGSVWAEKDDPRITRIGRITRKYRIDELPQFINVIMGQMSIIGPRPERLDLTLKFNEEIPGFVERLSVKPGITGLAQVSGGYDISAEEKLRFDRKYINNLSLRNEVKILWLTIKVVLTGDGAR